MAVTARGWGDFTRRLSGNRLDIVRSNGFTLNKAVEQEDIQTFPTGQVGALGILTPLVTSETWTVVLESGNIQDNTLPIIIGSDLSTESNVSVVKQVLLTIPTTAPYEVAVADLTLDQVVSATLVYSIKPPGDTYLTQIDAADIATIAEGQFAVEAGTITFHSSIADAFGDADGILINYRDTEATLPIIGGPSAANPIGSLEIFGKVQFIASNNVWNFWAPQATAAADLEFGSGVDNLSLEYTLGLPAGWALPFMLWQTVTP